MPSPSGANGRNARGQFTAGNCAGKGNPLAKRVGQLRTALVRAVSERDVEEIIRTMVEQAKAGDALSARLVLDRVLGKPEPLDIIARLEALEEADLS